LSFSPEGRLLLWNRWTVREKIFDEPFERLYRINGCSNSEWNDLVYTSERQSQCEIRNKTIHRKHNVTGKCAYYNIAFYKSVLWSRYNICILYIYVCCLLLSNSFLLSNSYVSIKTKKVYNFWISCVTISGSGILFHTLICRYELCRIILCASRMLRRYTVGIILILD